MTPSTQDEFFFDKYNQEYPAALSAFQFICDTLNEGLLENSNSKMLSLIPYIENGEGSLSFQYIGDTRRFLRILYILRLEEKYGLKTFTHDVSSCDALLEKYILSLFALRRLAFALSPQSEEEAYHFLLQNCLSPFAVYMLCNNELIVPSLSLYEKIASISSQFWTKQESLLFQSLTQQKRSENEFS